MHDKQVRRRRTVLGLLVVASLILLTAYFGESPSSPLHSLQRGIVEVLSPVETGASKVLSPVGDIAGWFSDTINAKSENTRLKRENATLTQQIDQLRYEQLQNTQLRGLVHLDGNGGIDQYAPVTGNVIERDPTLWYQTIIVDRGSDDGVHPNDPVIADKGLVGDVTSVGSTYSVVTLLTDHEFAVAAMVLDGVGDTGELQPAVGSPNQMVLGSLPSHANIQYGQQVVTAGFTDNQNPAIHDLYPAGIPIGQVATLNPQDSLLNNQQVQVVPAVDLRHITVVQILTKPAPGTQHAQAGTATVG